MNPAQADGTELAGQFGQVMRGERRIARGAQKEIALQFAGGADRTPTLGWRQAQHSRLPAELRPEQSEGCRSGHQLDVGSGIEAVLFVAAINRLAAFRVENQHRNLGSGQGRGGEKRIQPCLEPRWSFCGIGRRRRRRGCRRRHRSRNRGRSAAIASRLRGDRQGADTEGADQRELVAQHCAGLP